MDDPAQTPPSRPSEPLTYEETPIIEPIEDAPIGQTLQTETPAVNTSSTAQTPPAPVTQPESPKVQEVKPKSSFFRRIFGFIGTILFFAILFSLGIWLSTILRSYLPTGIPKNENTSTLESTNEQIEVQPDGPLTVESQEPWTSYPILAAGTKLPISGVTFEMPPEVLIPICDGASCVSQGTYLPGGSRFTVAARGSGLGLGYTQGAVITDAAGNPFTTTQITVTGRPALEYTGAFIGTTVGGFSFTQMRGVMIEVSNKLAIEFNHFAPKGVSVDFESDDVIFNKILESLTLPTPTSVPSATSTPTL